MEMVAAIVGGQKFIRMSGIADGRVKINDAVVGAAGANEIIDGLAFSFAVLCEVGCVLEWRQRTAEDRESPLVGARDDLQDGRQ